MVHGKQIDLTGFEPALCGIPLALGAVSVAAGVVGDLGLRAGGTTQHMATEGDTAQWPT